MVKSTDITYPQWFKKSYEFPIIENGHSDLCVYSNLREHEREHERKLEWQRHQFWEHSNYRQFPPNQPTEESIDKEDTAPKPQ